MKAEVNAVLRRGRMLWLGLAVLAQACGGGESPVESLPRILGSEGRSLGRFHFPRGIDLNAEGLIGVTDKTGRVQLLDADGRGLIEWQMPKMDNGTPTGVVFDSTSGSTDTLLVADTHNSRIMRYSLDGALMGMFGEYGGEPGRMIYPTDLAVDGDGNIYVTEYGERDRVMTFGADGTFIREWGDFGEDPGEFQRPLALIFRPPDRLIVADSCNHRIQTFSLRGELIRVWGEAGREPGQLSYPYDLALGKDDRLYIAEYGNNRIQCFTLEGGFVGMYGGPGRDPGQFGTPWGIAVGPDGLLYVADTLNHRLQVIEPARVNEGS